VAATCNRFTYHAAENGRCRSEFVLPFHLYANYANHTHVCFTPRKRTSVGPVGMSAKCNSGLMHRSKLHLYSITLSAAEKVVTRKMTSLFFGAISSGRLRYIGRLSAAQFKWTYRKS
jgi:hypothetical protein